MSDLIVVCLSAVCVLTPVFVLMLVGGVYITGIGALRIPGVSRSETPQGEDWTAEQVARVAEEIISSPEGDVIEI